MEGYFASSPAHVLLHVSPAQEEQGLNASTIPSSLPQTFCFSPLTPFFFFMMYYKMLMSNGTQIPAEKVSEGGPKSTFFPPR